MGDDGGHEERQDGVGTATDAQVPVGRASAALGACSIFLRPSPDVRSPQYLYITEHTSAAFIFPTDIHEEF